MYAWVSNVPCVSQPTRARRAGRPQDHLGHPDQKAIAADHANSDNRPDESGDDGKYEKFRTPAGPKCGLLRRLRIMLA